MIEIFGWFVLLAREDGVGVGVFEGGKKRCLSFFFAFLIRSLVVEMFDDQNEQQTTIRCLEVDELLVIKSY